MTIDYYYSWPIPQIIHIIDCFSAAFLHHKSRILHLWQGFENRSSYKEDPLAGTMTVSVNVQISTSALLHFDYSKLAIDETRHSLRKHNYCCYCSSFAKVEVAYDCCLNIWCLIVVLRASLTRSNSSACVQSIAKTRVLLLLRWSSCLRWPSLFSSYLIHVLKLLAIFTEYEGWKLDLGGDLKIDLRAHPFHSYDYSEISLVDSISAWFVSAFLLKHYQAWSFLGLSWLIY